MDSNQIVTKGDLAYATSEIINFIKQMLKANPLPSGQPVSKKYLRTRDIKNMFGVSANKLKDMRVKKEIPYIKRGSTFFYPEDEVIKSMNKD